MNRLLLVAIAALIVGLPMSVRGAEKSESPLTGEVKAIDGKSVDLSKYQGKVVLVVNVASECGNTPQYANLQSLYEQYSDEGLVVLGFPANEFGAQEPGTDAEIAEFCSTEYNVTFPMFSKIVVKGEGQAPLYERLTSTKSFEGPITWNFEKFLIGRDGQVIGRYKPGLNPEDPELVDDIKKALAAK